MVLWTVQMMAVLLDKVKLNQRGLVIINDCLLMQDKNKKEGFSMDHKKKN